MYGEKSNFLLWELGLVFPEPVMYVLIVYKLAKLQSNGL